MSSNPEQELEALLQFLKATRGFDFTAYKRASLQRRILKRMQMKGLESLERYQEYLEAHPDEFQHLFNTILINVTSFFRDSEAWEYVAQEVVPNIIAAKDEVDPIRVWCAGCASGEEAYSIAIVFAEALGAEQFRERVKIYATDVDEEALNSSRQAAYSASDLKAVAPELIERYFEPVNNKYVFDRDVRRSVIFGRHDLIQDAPISRVDLLICRNTLMYFNSETQDRILARFAFALRDGGFLFLGKAETMLSRASTFTAVDLKRRIFRKIRPHNGRDKNHLFLSNGDQPTPLLDGHVRLREAVLENLPGAQLVVDASGRIYHASERARSIFGLSKRDLGRPLQDLELSYRPLELRSLIETAITTHRPLEHQEVRWQTQSGEKTVLDMRISPLFDDTGKLLGVTINWDDVTHFKRLQDELVNFNQELETAYEELQSANEELQTTNEELQSTVEELETTNEELQSTNEELETMNEELQSTNEELETINEELRQRTEDLNDVNSFLNAILAGFQEGIIVVDREMNVLAWNPKSEDLWGLRADEVRGKHLVNLDIGLATDRIRPLVRGVIDGKQPMQIDEASATNRRGKTIKCQTRVMPLPSTMETPRGAIIVTEELPG